jgi:hypothetical protein
VRGIEFGQAVHTALDHLEAVALPLDQTIAPGVDDGCARGGRVLPKPADSTSAAIGPPCRSERGSNARPSLYVWQQEPRVIALARE